MRTVLCTAATLRATALATALVVAGLVTASGVSPARAVTPPEQTRTAQAGTGAATVPVDILDAVAFVRDADGGVRQYR
jgi:hypothetical protein